MRLRRNHPTWKRVGCVVFLGGAWTFAVFVMALAVFAFVRQMSAP